MSHATGSVTTSVITNLKEQRMTGSARNRAYSLCACRYMWLSWADGKGFSGLLDRAALPLSAEPSPDSPAWGMGFRSGWIGPSNRPVFLAKSRNSKRGSTAFGARWAGRRNVPGKGFRSRAISARPTKPSSAARGMPDETDRAPGHEGSARMPAPTPRPSRPHSRRRAHTESTHRGRTRLMSNLGGWLVDQLTSSCSAGC